MKPDSVHLAGGDAGQDVRAGRASSEAAPSHPMVVKAAREMARIHAEACNVNRDDLWMVEGQSFIDEAESVLSACGAVEVLEALCEVKQILDMVMGVSGGYPLEANGPARKALNAIRKATLNTDSATGSPLREGTRPDAKEGAA